MPKVIKGNLNDAANKILQGISVETTKGQAFDRFIEA